MAIQPGLCRTWSETPKKGFLAIRLIRDKTHTLSCRFSTTIPPVLASFQNPLQMCFARAEVAWHTARSRLDEIIAAVVLYCRIRSDVIEIIMNHYWIHMLLETLITYVNQSQLLAFHTKYLYLRDLYLKKC